MISIRDFGAGLVIGAAGYAIAIQISTWWTPKLSRADQYYYDSCLLANQGSKTACDAGLRLYQQVEAATALKMAEAKRMLQAGRTKREVVDWALNNGLGGQGAADAVGISWRDLMDGKY